MQKVYKAFIDEDNCIGCSKCIRVCPTDAIVGAKRMLHTVLSTLCTSCEKCINACPTNCISLSTFGEAMPIDEEKRLTEQKLARSERKTLLPLSFTKVKKIETPSLVQVDTRKQSVADAIARVKARKNLK